jgi:hypothetical protein
MGMMFIPNDDALEAQCKEIFDKVAKAENFKVGPCCLASLRMRAAVSLLHARRCAFS